MEKHPGGSAQTRRLLELSGLAPPLRILDMGAGDGDAVRLLRSLGFKAEGIDLAPGRDVSKGDFLACPQPDGSFGAVLAQCSFFICGSRHAALCEARRLLAPGGLLLYSDVWFEDRKAAFQELEAAGVRVVAFEDVTTAWREYYIACIWNGTADALCKHVPQGKCRYYLTVCERM
jgi:ubiquinone/menaquinone biosynthesis C-methylase UbiE